MKKRVLFIIFSILIIAAVVLSGCVKVPAVQNSYTQITAEQAKKIMDEQTGYIILDVRTKAEYDDGHIPGAILLPNEQIGKEDITQLPNKDQLLLVYCRSGNRSKQASSKLVDLGYTNVHEFGGITSWPYDIVTD